MPFSVSGELCMVRKAVRHALIMALETFTIDDKIYLSWSKSPVTEHVSVLQMLPLAACRRALSRTTVTRLLSAVSGLYAVGGTHRQPARGKQKHRRTNETDINDS